MADDNPFLVLEELRCRFFYRKRLLFVVACWRDVWHLIPDENQRQAVQNLETFADTSIFETEVVFNQLEIETKFLDRVWGQVGFQSQPPWDEAVAVAAATILVTSAAMESTIDSGHAWMEADRARHHAEGLGLLQVWESRTARHAAILRHLAGDTSQPYSFPAHWPTDVVRLARALYDGEACAYALHDALLEAGHADFADHFREAEHPKGCWALDAIVSRK